MIGATRSNSARPDKHINHSNHVWHLRSGISRRVIAPSDSSRPVTLTANPTTCPRVPSFRFGCGHNSKPSRPFGFGVPLGQSKPRKKRRLRDPLGDTSVSSTAPVCKDTCLEHCSSLYRYVSRALLLSICRYTSRALLLSI